MHATPPSTQARSSQVEVNFKYSLIIIAVINIKGKLAQHAKKPPRGSEGRGPWDPSTPAWPGHRLHSSHTKVDILRVWRLHRLT